MRYFSFPVVPLWVSMHEVSTSDHDQLRQYLVEKARECAASLGSEMESWAVPSVLENSCPGHAGGPPALLVTQLLQTLLAAHCAVNDPRSYPRDRGDDVHDREEFDFVVVGAGSSGSVIASRLSERSEWKVLLLEAGGDPSFTSDIPSFLFNNQGSELDWKYLSERSDEYCVGTEEKRCPYPRGKVLGGSSTLNAMLYVRGNSRDFDEWEEMGNEGWGYDRVLKYFKRSEQLNGYSLADDETYEKNMRVEEFKKKIMSEKYHSTSGLLSVSPFGNGGMEDIKNAIFGAVRELNISAQEDLNGRNQIGFSEVPGTLFQGRRGNTAKMYLNHVKDRPNLIVVKNAVARRVLISDGRAEGVEFVRNGRRCVVLARKEVVLSAGAINSPEILMLSGMGAEKHLQAAGISLVKNLPGVGENLQDHAFFPGIPYSILKDHSQPPHPFLALDAMYMFLTNREGLFSSIGMTDLTGFIDTLNNSSVPDIQYIFVNFPKQDPVLLPEVLRALHFTKEIKAMYTDMVKDSPALVIAPVVLRPKSRGRVLLDEQDTNRPPKIFAELLKHPQDKQTLLRGVSFLSKLSQTSAFKTLQPKLLRFRIRECNEHKFESDAYWTCLMKYVASSLYHPVGTCKMGPSSDPFAVVDERLRVHGIQNLRVADASIMPTIVRGNTNAACIMIAEKAADMIKSDWKLKEHAEL